MGLAVTSARRRSPFRCGPALVMSRRMKGHMLEPSERRSQPWTIDSGASVPAMDPEVAQKLGVGKSQSVKSFIVPAAKAVAICDASGCLKMLSLKAEFLVQLFVGRPKLMSVGVLRRRIGIGFHWVGHQTQVLRPPTGHHVPGQGLHQVCHRGSACVFGLIEISQSAWIRGWQSRRRVGAHPLRRVFALSPPAALVLKIQSLPMEFSAMWTALVGMLLWMGPFCPDSIRSQPCVVIGFRQSS